MKKLILDACCGGRMFWFNKHHPNTLYVDNRQEKNGFYNNPGHKVEPDKIMDFRKLELEDKSFKLIVFDPPHLVSNCKTGAIAKEYGVLSPETWKEDIKKGFNECWRVLDDYGTLIFKWNECSIKRKEILNLIEKEPLFGHQVGARLKTHWFCFMKIPEFALHENDGEDKE